MKINKIKRFVLKYKIPLLLFLIVILIVSISILVTHAFFTGTISQSLINGRVGALPSSDGDMVINIYQENRNSSGEGINTYSLVDSVPLGGYNYNSSTSRCINGSTLTYDDSTHSFSITASRTDTCNLYFDAAADADLMINVFQERRNSNGVAQGTYEKTDSIPLGGYELDTSSSGCSENATYTYDDSTHSYSVTSAGKATCNLYFESVADSDIIINIYRISDSSCGTDLTNYEQLDYVPQGREFNSTNSSCTNGATVTFDGTYVVVTAPGKTVCSAYFD